MQTYSMKVNAINAARRFMAAQSLSGDWTDHFYIDSIGPRQFVVQHKQPEIDRSEAWQSLMVATEGEFMFPTADYIESNRDEPLSERSAALRAFFNSRSPESEAALLAEGEHENEIDDHGYGDKIEDDERQAERIANAAASEERLPNGKVWIRLSSVDKPVKRVWAIADEMIAANPNVTRKEVQEECVRRGIASGTARTQYQAWSTARKAALQNATLAAELSKKFNS